MDRSAARGSYPPRRRLPDREVSSSNGWSNPDGGEIALGDAMFDKKIDERPGPVPDIRADGDSVIFVMTVRSEDAELTIRCDPDGAIRVSIAPSRRCR
jgi:hypothetical protein